MRRRPGTVCGWEKVSRSRMDALEEVQGQVPERGRRMACGPGRKAPRQTAKSKLETKRRLRRAALLTPMGALIIPAAADTAAIEKDGEDVKESVLIKVRALEQGRS